MNHARVLHGEETLGHDDIKDHRQHKRCECYQQRCLLVIEHPGEHFTVAGNHSLEEQAAGTIKSALFGFGDMVQQFRAHHGRERQGNNRRNKDGHGQRDGEFAEQPTHNIPHEQKRDQHGHERDGQGDNGESDLLRAFDRGFQGGVALLDVSRDILYDDDGVIHDKSRGNGERHQRQVVDAETCQIHHAESADERKRHGDAGYHGGREVAQKQEDHHDDERHRQDQFELDVLYGSPDGGGPVGE